MKTFTLELKTSNACSLRCVYCYESFTDTHMTIETFNKSLPKIINMMEASNTTKLNMSFFGGEPLLNWEIIEHATKVLRKLPIDVSLVLISNLTEIDEYKTKFLLDNGIGVSWSFDGMFTDASRPMAPQYITRKSDGSTYKSTLELYKEKMPLIKQLTSGCKHMVFPGNSKDMANNLDFFIEFGIHSPDFSIVRDDIWTKENLISFRTDIRKLGDRYIHHIEAGTFCQVGFFRLYILDNLMGLTKGKRPFGCFAGIHGAILSTEGEFYPCARFLDKKVMKMDENHDFKYWSEKFNPQNFDKCQSCSLKNVCNAGCTYSQVRNDNKPLDSVCELFHIIQEETQRIVGILKHNKTFQAVVESSLKNMG